MMAASTDPPPINIAIKHDTICKFASIAFP
jgi:hypothetical protein